MLPSYARGKHFSLFASLLILNIAHPLIGSTEIGQLVWTITLWGVLLGALRQFHRGPWSLGIVVIVAAVLSGLTNLGFEFAGAAGSKPAWVLTAFLVTHITLFSWVGVVALKDVLGGARVNADKLFGAVAVYGVLALVFTLVFMLLTLFSDALQHNGVALDFREQGGGDFLYFSYVTLTTLGYGDITPQTQAARMCASLEAVAGQLYLTILVARLVGLSTTSIGTAAGSAEESSIRA